ncbi:MAG: Gfo/Idh/MocA family oxidoreductase [Victivallales bacterium]|nr:Gfo/Idh/MocA family oxidoreductase [Victivallales bacterium]
MANVITYGTFDFFHEGHRRILERAREFCGEKGKLFVGVTSENYDRERGKLNVVQSLVERMRQVRASGLADEIFVEEYEGQKIEDVQRYKIDTFVIGDDWLGKYEYLKEWCDVVYLPRTKGVSSTMIRNDTRHILRGGIVGCGRIANRFIVESRFVSGIVFDAVCNPIRNLADEFAAKHSITDAYSDFDAMLQSVDVVYVATPHPFHAEYVRKALTARKHVLCEKPLTLDYDEAKDLYALASKNGVILQEALKTAFAPCFKRLVNLAKGGVIGKVRQVNAVFTRLTPDKTLREYDPAMGGGAISELASYVLCPIIKLLGPVEPEQMTIHSLRDVGDKVETFTTGMIKYTDATGIFTIGLSAKTEGSLTVAGTTGYIYVPSPWWKTEYFEIRNDMGQTVRRVFNQFVGDGLRYELAEFVNAVSCRRTLPWWGDKESLALLRLLTSARA